MPFPEHTYLDLRLIRDGWFKLLSPLEFFSNVLNRTIVVPAGFQTDLASVPRLPVAYAMFGGKASKAAVIHDWLLHEGVEEREDCDLVFREAMTADPDLELTKEEIDTMYYAVAAFTTFKKSEYPHNDHNA